MIRRYDPEISISDEISTESDRVLFLKSTAKIMLAKARVKLNLKRLYGADGYAVRELLKIANMLRDATTKAEAQAEPVGVESLDLDRKNLDPKQVREHATDITRCGAFLYDILQNEIKSRDLRYRAVNSKIDLEEIERAVQNSIQSVKENITNLDIQLDELEKDKSNLESKIEKRRAELERSEKRLSTLQSVKPAYMDEYELLQAQMQDLYTKYLERHRNLEYLESQLELHRSTEQQQIDAASKKIRKMQKRLQDEEMRILRGEAAIEERALTMDDDDITDITEDSGFLSPGQSTLQTTRRRSIVETQLPGNLISSAEKTVQGSLAINDDDDDSDEDAFSDLTEASEDSDTHLSVNDEDGLDEEDLIEGDDDADILSGDDFTTEGSDNEF